MSPEQNKLINSKEKKKKTLGFFPLLLEWVTFIPAFPVFMDTHGGELHSGRVKISISYRHFKFTGSAD